MDALAESGPADRRTVARSVPRRGSRFSEAGADETPAAASDSITYEHDESLFCAAGVTLLRGGAMKPVLMKYI
jgi:hypothetical protein